MFLVDDADKFKLEYLDDKSEGVPNRTELWPCDYAVQYDKIE